MSLSDMPMIDVLTGISNGLGGAFAILWTLLGTRTVLHSWAVTDQPEAVRVSAWNWWRAGIVLLAVTMTWPYNFENIWRAEGMISPMQSIILQTVAHVMHCIAVCFLLAGLDVSRAGSAWSMVAYFLIIPLCAIGGLVLK